ncbi:MAG: TlpA disulfide reductase family protein [Flavobacteriaceae bacterium]
MKKTIFALMLLSAMVGCKKEQSEQTEIASEPEITKSTVPEMTSETEFGRDVLQQELRTIEGNTTTFEEVLNMYKGKPILIDFWGSWCPDCIKGMPKVHKLQEEFDLVYIFLSFDRTEKDWKEGIKKHKTIGKNFLVITESEKEKLRHSLRIDWIPRYILVSPDGRIAHFRAIEADDPKLIEKIKELTK